VLTTEHVDDNRRAHFGTGAAAGLMSAALIGCACRGPDPGPTATPEGVRRAAAVTVTVPGADAGPLTGHGGAKNRSPMSGPVVAERTHRLVPGADGGDVLADYLAETTRQGTHWFTADCSRPRDQVSLSGAQVVGGFTIDVSAFLDNRNRAFRVEAESAPSQTPGVAATDPFQTRDCTPEVGVRLRSAAGPP
jgi:hypothetical protein